MADPAKSIPHQAPDNTELMALVLAVASQDETALARLYDGTVSRVYGLALAMAGNQADAEEVVCDVYLQVWRRAAQYDERRGSVLAWLLVNCRSLALDLLRRRRSREKGQEPLDVHTLDAADEGLSAEELLNLVQEGTAVHRALSELPEIQCRLIGLAYFRDMSHQEIAELLQLPLGTVKSHIRRGLQHMRKYIDR